MSLLISLGLSQYQPPPGIERTIRNFKIDPVFLKDEPKPVVKKAKPPKPKKPTSHQLKLESMERIVEVIHAGANTQALIAKRARVSLCTASRSTRQLEAEKRISVDHNSTPKKYYRYGRRPYRVDNKNFIPTDSMKLVLEAVNNGANTQELVTKYIGRKKGSPSRTLRLLVDNKLIRCESAKWPREYYPMGK